MHPLRISPLVLKINKNAFKFILNGLEHGIITKSKQKEIVIIFQNSILKNYQHHYHKKKSNKNTIKNEFNLYLETLGRHSFYPYATKKSKKIQIDLDDTVYSAYLPEINFYAWLINRNLHNYVLEEIINNEKKYATKKQKKECEVLIPVTRIKINHDSM